MLDQTCNVLQWGVLVLKGIVAARDGFRRKGTRLRMNAGRPPAWIVRGPVRTLRRRGPPSPTTPCLAPREARNPREAGKRAGKAPSACSTSCDSSSSRLGMVRASLAAVEMPAMTKGGGASQRWPATRWTATSPPKENHYGQRYRSFWRRRQSRSAASLVFAWPGGDLLCR